MKREGCMDLTDKATEPSDGVMDRCLAEYDRVKRTYLELCRKHALNPFDLDLVGLAILDLPTRDKSSLARHMIRLVKMERHLRGRVGPGLFPLTTRQVEDTGYMVPKSGK